MFQSLRRREIAQVPQSWRLLLPAWLSVGAVTLIVGATRLAGVSIPMSVQLLAYLIGLVAINLPHGGFENLQNLRTRSVRYQALYAGGFFLLAGTFVGLLFVDAVLGVFLMILVAVVKGGLGGVAVLDAVTGTDHLTSRPQRWLAAAVRGSAVMFVPYVAFADTFEEYTGFMISVFDNGALEAATYAFHPLSYYALPAAVGLGALAHIGLSYARDPGSGTWLVDAIETILLISFFAVVPVVLAVGLYFPLWYSARQVARSVAADRDRPAADEAWMVGENRGQHVRSVLNWSMFIVGGVLTGLLVVGLWVVAPESALSVTEGVYNDTLTDRLAAGVVFYTMFVSIIALPHVLLGGVLDRQGIWFIP